MAKEFELWRLSRPETSTSSAEAHLFTPADLPEDAAPLLGENLSLDLSS
jgi:hypothetical protein